MANYYCLVAGFFDYGFDADRKTLNWELLREEIVGALTKNDRAKLELLMELTDVRNIVACSLGGEWRFSPMGTMSEEDIKIITSLLTKEESYDEDTHSEIKAPAYIQNILRAITDTEWAEKHEVVIGEDLEVELYKAYFEAAEHSGKGFVREWCRVEQNIRNITAAFIARKMGITQDKYIIGEYPVTEQLRVSTQSDFGLKDDIPYLEELINILSGGNILKKERDADMLRLDIIDEMNTFNYFNIDVVLGYYLKIAMIDRWLALSPEEGKEIFERIVKGLSSKDFSDKIAEGNF